jgi:hypothetical protein
MASTWIIVVNFNGLEDTRRCLASLKPVLRDNVHVLVVDNASDVDPKPELEVTFPWCHWIRNETNQGWAGGNNRGMEWAFKQGADHVVLLNNDTEVSPDLIDRLSAAALTQPHWGIMGPIVRDLDPPQKVQTDGFFFGEPNQPGFFSRRPLSITRTDPPSVTAVDIVMGCCLWIHRRVVDRIGLFDERFFLIHEESDFCLRAISAGFGVGIVTEDLVWHKHSATFAASGKPWQRYYNARNLWLLIHKHPEMSRRGHGVGRSRREYVMQMYYYYQTEREAKRWEAADAILEGTADAFTGQWGPYRPRRRWLVPLLRVLFILGGSLATLKNWFFRSVPRSRGESVC